MCECGHGATEGVTWTNKPWTSKDSQFGSTPDYHLINEFDDDAPCRAPWIACPCKNFVPRAS